MSSRQTRKHRKSLFKLFGEKSKSEEFRFSIFHPDKPFKKGGYNDNVLKKSRFGYVTNKKRKKDPFGFF